MKILVIAPHPDDEVLGCFGTVSKLIKKGYEAYTLILSQGKTSRGEGDEEIAILKEEIQKANGVIGIKKIFLENFPDNSFDSVPLLTIIKKISKVIEEIKPEIIFTHYANDLNIDHRLTYQALITATRPMQGCFVKEIYSFEILSSTEWNYPLSFSPNTYFDIGETIDLKIKAMQKATETRSNKAKKKIDKAIKTLQAQNKVITHYSIMKESSVAFQTVKKYIDESLLKSLNETDNLTPFFKGLLS